MLGNTLLRYFSQSNDKIIRGTVRNKRSLERLSPKLIGKCKILKNIENDANLFKELNDFKPDVVINCIGIVKQRAESKSSLQSIKINSLLPHRLDKFCSSINSRLVHISTDCVFSGKKGNYREDDVCDADDIYGRSKLLGEVANSNAITIRTSIIGHELSGSNGLLNWFLEQDGKINGFKRAIFSGLPTIELAQVIDNYVIPNPQINGIFHLSAEPISKLELLKLLKSVYKQKVTIISDSSVIINRSLDSSKFTDRFGYKAPAWPDLITKMSDFG